MANSTFAQDRSSAAASPVVIAVHTSVVAPSGTRSSRPDRSVTSRTLARRGRNGPVTSAAAHAAYPLRSGQPAIGVVAPASRAAGDPPPHPSTPATTSATLAFHDIAATI